MDNLFIDTSIFESNNFFESKRIKEIFKLSREGHLRVVLPKLTYDEIENRLYKNIDEASQKLKKYKDETRVLRNVHSLSNKLEDFSIDGVKKEVSEILNKVFTEAKFEIIDYPTLDIGDIFKSYFKKEFPFGSGGKKSEFPDAFALKTIELWAKSNSIKVLTFSKDNDMLNYQSANLEIIDDFGKYLSNKIKEVEAKKYKARLDEVEDIIYNNSDNILQKIRDWLEDQLDDYTKYYDYSNFYEVHEYEVKEINIDIEDYNITSVSEEYISTQLKLYVNYKVEIIIDDEETMVRDYETKDWIFIDTKPVLVDEIRYINAELIFEIDPDNTTVYEPELESINDNKQLNV